MELLPPFSLPASTGQTLSRESFLGKVPVVVVFLADPRGPSDRELLQAYSRLLADFGATRTQVLAVARLTAREARELADELAVNVPLLADAGGEMAAAFDALAPDGTVRRLTVLADTDGGIVRRLEPSPPDPDAVLHAVRDLGLLSPTDELALQEPPD